MKFINALGAIAWVLLALEEVGAAFDWWAASHPHWWLAGTFLLMAVSCLRTEQLSTSDGQTS